MHAYPITDENAKQAARQAFFSKYPDPRKQEGSRNLSVPGCISFASRRDGMTNRKISVDPFTRIGGRAPHGDAE